MLLGAGLSGVALLGTWAGLMWVYLWVGALPNGKDPDARARSAGAGFPVMTRCTVWPGLVMTSGFADDALVVRSASVATPSVTEGSDATPAVMTDASASVAVEPSRATNGTTSTAPMRGCAPW